MDTEWNIDVSDIEQKILELAEKDIEQGNFVPHTQVMEELEEYLVQKK